MSLDQICVVTVGCVNTAIAAIGLDYLAQAGELSYGGTLNIGPGGKSANMAQMIAILIGKNRVAMVSKTSKDKLNLWRFPIDALEQHGVNTKFIKALSFEETNKYPCIALIPVDRSGAPQIYVIPGINDEFLPQDISDSQELFDAAAKQRGVVVLSLELPVVTAEATARLAHEQGIRLLLDPGGMLKDADYRGLFEHPIFLLKPNEHEAKMLTGIDVRTKDDARLAARKLQEWGVENVLITLGDKGAFLLTDKTSLSLDVPPALLNKQSSVRDQTGCGDQSMAALCAALIAGATVEEAARQAVVAGTLEFYKEGVLPVSKEELEDALRLTSGESVARASS
ncbi:unnamed protein product [Sphagnum jensenii]